MLDNNIFKIEVFIPENYVDTLRDNLNKIRTLSIGGNYDSCMSCVKVLSYWRPLKGADPFEGKIGELCKVYEMKVEFACKKKLLEDTLKTIKKIHPYEEPVINVIPMYTFKDFISE